MDKKQPERVNDCRRTGADPLTLDDVLVEVVRILDEERAGPETDASGQLAA